MRRALVGRGVSLGLSDGLVGGRRLLDDDDVGPVVVVLVVAAAEDANTEQAHQGEDPADGVERPEGGAAIEVAVPAREDPRDAKHDESHEPDHVEHPDHGAAMEMTMFNDHLVFNRKG